MEARNLVNKNNNNVQQQDRPPRRYNLRQAHVQEIMQFQARQERRNYIEHIAVVARPAADRTESYVSDLFDEK